MPKERVDRLNEISFVWDHIEEFWNRNYQSLQQYQELNGHCNVPGKSGSLGRWVHVQRQTRKKGKLSERKINLLDNIGFVWDGIEDQWNKKYEKYKECLESNSQIPQVIATWATSKRRDRINGKLSDERIKALDKINFEWDPVNAKWYENYNALKRHIETTNDIKDLSSQPPFGSWVCSQRAYYKKGTLPQDKVDLLMEIGLFVLDPHENYWEKMFQELVEFHAIHGNCISSEVEENVAVGCSGFVKQRQRRRRGELSEEKIKRLDALDFIWKAGKHNLDQNQI